jgi:hydroxyethylthiazole kinase-like sugar kinase family protein
LRFDAQTEGLAVGSEVPLMGPGYGVVGAGCLSCAIMAATISTKSTMRVIRVPRRTAGG